MQVEELGGLAGRLLEYMLECTSVGVAVLDTTGRIRSVNPAMVAMAAGPEGRLINRNLEDLIAPSFAEPLRLAMDEARIGGQSEIRASIVSFDGVFRSCVLRLMPDDSCLLAIVEPDTASAADLDEMTGAETPETFSAQLSLELYRSGRYRRPLAVLKCEIDDVESITRDYGEEVAERMIARVGWSLRKHTRRTDMVARVAAAQFAILLPETDLIGAFVAAEKLSRTVKDISVETSLGDLHPTACFGVVAASDAGDVNTPQTLTEAADWVLSLAQRSGPGGIEAAPSIAYRMAG